MHECVFSFKSNFFQWCSVVFNGQVLHSSKPLLFDAGSRAVPTGDLMIKSHSRTLSVWRLVSLVVKENWRAYLYDSSPPTFLLLVCILNSLGTGPVCRTYQLICCHLYGFSTMWKIKDTEKRGFGAWQNFLVSRLLAVWSGASYFIWAAVFSFFNWVWWVGGGLGREKIELWAGQGKSSQEERITTHILAKVLIRAFTPQKYPAVKSKFELYCS